jgi:hypothetical protein
VTIRDVSAQRGPVLPWFTGLPAAVQAAPAQGTGAIAPDALALSGAPAPLGGAPSAVLQRLLTTRLVTYGAMWASTGIALPTAPVPAPAAPVANVPIATADRGALKTAVLAEADKWLSSTPDPMRGPFAPAPYYKPGQDGVPDPNRDMTQLNQLMTFARTMNALCQAYALTHDGRYAEKAVQTADAWARTTPPTFGSAQGRYDAFFRLSSVWTSMEALKTYPGWDATRRDRTLAWVHAYAEEGARFKASNNIDDWRRLFTGAAARLTGDRALFDQEVAGWKTSVAAQIDERGLMPEELKRTRSLWYHQYGLKPIVTFAELARAEGIDLYNTPTGQEVGRALETVAPSLMDPKTWTGKEIEPDMIQPKTSYALYQIAAARYPQSAGIQTAAQTFSQRLKQQPDWLKQQITGGYDGRTNVNVPLPAADLH